MRDQAEQILFAGSYGEGDDEAPTLHVLAFDAATGRVRTVSQNARIPNATYLDLHPNGRFVYAVSETNNGELAAFALEDSSLRLLNRVSAHGGAPCYVAVHPAGGWLIAANYSGGSAVVAPIRDDGTLGEATDVQHYEGTGGNPKRQTSPHAHSAVFDASGAFAYVQDLGTDKLMQYRFDANAGKLAPMDPPFAKVAPGSGPRHLVFHPTMPLAYVINEIMNTVTLLQVDRRTGALRAIEAWSTLPDDVAVKSYCADIHVSPSGEYVYGSNRGHDTLAVFHVEPQTGRLSLAGHTPTGGDWPRGFVIAPDGRFVLVANQKSDNIVVFRTDPESGHLSPTGHELGLPAPVCLKFLT